MEVRIARDGNVKSAQVDDISLSLSADFVKVTAAQKQRLENSGVKLETKSVDSDSEGD